MKEKQEKYDLVGKIIAYEQGDLDDADTLILFGELIKNGQAWTLQGHYGRTAKALIEGGLVSKEGEVDWDAYAKAME